MITKEQHIKLCLLERKKQSSYAEYVRAGSRGVDDITKEIYERAYDAAAQDYHEYLASLVLICQ